MQPERNTKGLSFGGKLGHDIKDSNEGTIKVARELNIIDGNLKAFGYAANCPGCDAKRQDRPRRLHNRTCRASSKGFEPDIRKIRHSCAAMSVMASGQRVLNSRKSRLQDRGPAVPFLAERGLGSPRKPQTTKTACKMSHLLLMQTSEKKI